MDELNVKEIQFSEDDQHLVTLKAKPNFRILGKKIGKKMPQAQALINNFSFAELSELLSRKNEASDGRGGGGGAHTRRCRGGPHR